VQRLRQLPRLCCAHACGQQPPAQPRHKPGETCSSRMSPAGRAAAGRGGAGSTRQKRHQKARERHAPGGLRRGACGSRRGASSSSGGGGTAGRQRGLSGCGTGRSPRRPSRHIQARRVGGSQHRGGGGGSHRSGGGRHRAGTGGPGRWRGGGRHRRQGPVRGAEAAVPPVLNVVVGAARTHGGVATATRHKRWRRLDGKGERAGRIVRPHAPHMQAVVHKAAKGRPSGTAAAVEVEGRTHTNTHTPCAHPQRVPPGVPHPHAPAHHMLGDLGPPVAVHGVQRGQLRVLLRRPVTLANGRVDLVVEPLTALLAVATGQHDRHVAPLCMAQRQGVAQAHRNTRGCVRAGGRRQAENGGGGGGRGWACNGCPFFSATTVTFDPAAGQPTQASTLAPGPLRAGAQRKCLGAKTAGCGPFGPIGPIGGGGGGRLPAPITALSLQSGYKPCGRPSQGREGWSRPPQRSRARAHCWPRGTSETRWGRGPSAGARRGGSAGRAEGQETEQARRR
jgi:hypothetical protein